jgi:uncharacterized protein (DUF1501 family)
MKRRTFLKSALSSAAAAPFLLEGLPVRATSPLKFLAQLPQAAIDDRILIICQLFGGNDGLNTVIPADDSTYYQIRPAIAVPKDQCWTGLGNIYLTPALNGGSPGATKGGIAKMLEQGNVAIIQGIGYDKPNLSHFRSTDIWLSGFNDSNPDNRLDTGWVGRFLEKKYPNFPASLPDDPLAIQLGGFSLALTSSKGRMGIEVINPAGQKGVGTMNDTLDPASTGTAYEAEYAFVADVAARSNKYAQRVKDAYAAGKTKLKGTYGQDSFAQQLASVAALIAGGLKSKVYVVSLGGFDTHVSQTLAFSPTVVGAHPTLLQYFSDAVATFVNDMIGLEMGDRVVGLTVSEFGRRPYENGSYGTDHGTSSVQFVFGTQVNSGIFGKTPDLKNLDENGDLVYDIDYREVYMEILTDWFGADSTEAREVLKNPFPGEDDSDQLYPLDVIKAQQNSAARDYSIETLSIRSNYPNPFANTTTLEVAMPAAGNLSIEISSLSGGEIMRVMSRDLVSGVHRIPLSLDLSSGNYLCIARAGSAMASKMIQCVR